MRDFEKVVTKHKGLDLRKGTRYPAAVLRACWKRGSRRHQELLDYARHAGEDAEVADLPRASRIAVGGRATPPRQAIRTSSKPSRRPNMTKTRGTAQSPRASLRRPLRWNSCRSASERRPALSRGGPLRPARSTTCISASGSRAMSAVACSISRKR